MFRPEEIYREVRNVAPDLIAHFGGLSWRSVGGVGYRAVHVRENDTGPDDCNHARFGAWHEFGQRYQWRSGSGTS